MAGKGKITCHLPGLESGRTVYLKVSTRSAGEDLLRAAASIAGPAPDPVENNNQDITENLTVLPRIDWIIPFFNSSPELASGLALSNLSGLDSHLLLRAFLKEGSQPLPLNPRSYLLPRRRQTTLLAREVFGEWPDASAGWLQIKADSRQLAGFFQIFGPTSLDGAAPATAQFRQAVFTRVIQGPRAYRMLPATTHLSLANPNPESVEVLLRLGRGPKSPPGKARTFVIEPGGLLFEDIAELFDGAEVKQGRVVAEVVEGPGLVGFQLTAIDGGVTLIGLNPAQESSATNLYSAQAASAKDLFTDLKLYNTSAQSRRLQVEMRNDDGELVAAAVEIVLAPGEERQAEIGTLFGLSHSTAGNGGSGDPVTGSLDVAADGPGIVGDVLFGDPEGHFAAALPLQTRLFSRAAFSQVASGQGLFTGLALYNPGDIATDVVLSVFAPSGSRRGAALITLGGRQRIARTLVELIPGVRGQVDGYLLLESELPIVAQQLFANRDLTFLSAGPPTILE